MSWVKVVVVLLIAFGALQWWQSRPVEHLPGVVVSEQPLQVGLADHVGPFSHGDYRVIPLAGFKVKARVLASERYRFDREADLVPVDLALGWGPMSDSTVLEHIDIRQSNRFYYWSVNRFPIPRRDIETHSANMHLIPASADVEDRIRGLRAGDVVSFEGFLVEVRSGDRWRWRSSLSREDKGAGACELVWVEDLSVL